MAVIKLDKLCKSFGNFTAVDSISFEVNEGEIFGFLGPNGAGKTTTLSMLSTLLKPTSGDAFVNGFNIRKQGDSVRKSIGIVFQDPSLDDELTACENMDFHGRLYGIPGEQRRKKIKELLTLVKLYERRNDLVKTFSGGMKRRLEIARGLLHEPKVLFLDEPTLGLDPQTRNKLWEYIKTLNKAKEITIILTTHYMDEADKLCDRIAIIDHGKIVAIDTSDRLKNKIGGDVITIETSDKEKMSSVLGKCGWCKSTKIHDGSVTISINRAEKYVAKIVKLAEKNKIDITSLAVTKPSLEDVFLNYTGKTIREQEATPLDNLRMRRRAWTGRR
jgi:ABC-2 type transport system ATP-binding protein